MKIEHTSQAGMLASTDSKFIYISGGNAQAIWRKYGWVPPSEVRTDYLFGKTREIAGGKK
jgi:hypothetical protein